MKSEAGASAAAASLKTSGGDEVVDADLDDDFGDDDDDDQLWRGPWGPTHTCFPFFPFMVKIFTVAGG